MEVEDFALAGQEVIFDVEPVHGFEVAAEDGGGDEIGDGSGFVAPVLDSMQSFRAMPEVLSVLLVPLRNAGIEFPAIVIEARLSAEFLDLVPLFLFKMQETDDDIRDLHSGVVDVVLNVNFPLRKTKKTDKCVAENGVAEVSDVRGLVGIDAGVLDENLARGDVGGGLVISRKSAGERGAVDTGIDVSRAGEFELVETFDGADIGDDFLGNHARRLAQFLRQLKGQRQRVFAEFDSGWLFDDHAAQVEIVGATHEFAHLEGKTAFEIAIQSGP